MKKIILITILTGMIYCQSDDRYPYFSERAGDWVNPSPELDCYGSLGSGCILFSVSRSNENYSGRDFSGSQIREVAFRSVDFSGTNFTGADLRSISNDRQEPTNFYNSNLVGANFTNAFLESVEFHESDLTDADFSNANFTSSIFDMDGSSDPFDFNRRVDFRRSNLTNANFTGVNLGRVDFTDAIISGIDFSLAEYLPPGWILNEDGISFPDGWEIITEGLPDAGRLIFNNPNTPEYIPRESEDRYPYFSERAGDWVNPYPESDCVGFLRCVFRERRSNENYSGRDLSGAQIREVEFRNVDLSGANFTGADLRSISDDDQHSFTDFRLSNLVGANFTNAFLEGVEFNESDLTDADFSNANFISPISDLDGRSDLFDLTKGVSFRRSNLTNANFTGVNLAHVDFTGADLTGVDLRGADITGFNFRETNLTGADLTGADLRGADLTGVDLTGVDLTGAILAGATLVQTVLTGADLTGADLTGAILTGAELIRANLTGAILAGADLTQTYLTGVNLAEADLREVRSSDIIGTPFRLPDGWSLVAGELIIDEGESSTTPAEENTIELGDDLSFNNIRTEINRVFDERRNYSLFKKIDITGDAQIEWRELVRIIGADGIESISIDQFDNFILQFIKALIKDDDLFNNIRPELDLIFDERRNYSLFKKIDITEDAQIEWRELVRIIGADGIESISIDQFDNFIIQFINGLIID